MSLEERVIRALIKTNAQTTDDTLYEGAMMLACNILGKSEEEVAEMLYDGPKEDESADELLWNLLKAHFGHTVEIAAYGDPEDPVCLCLEDMETNEVILDAELYTICAREDTEE